MSAHRPCPRSPRTRRLKNQMQMRAEEITRLEDLRWRIWQRAEKLREAQAQDQARLHDEQRWLLTQRKQHKRCQAEADKAQATLDMLRELRGFSKQEMDELLREDLREYRNDGKEDGIPF